MSSLFAALGVAVSGLNAQSQSIGNISDNLANAETTGYKNIGTNFSSLVTASSSTSNSPGGVSATPSYQNAVQGNITTTETTTNLAISGQGFFVVTTATQNASGQTEFTGSTLYTRSGDFTMNTSGYMVNGAGYYLEGYTITDGIVNTASVTPIQISALLDNPEPTTTITYSANLPANATNYTSSASTVDVYDTLGSTHETSVVWETTSTTGVWEATVTVEDGGGTGVDYVATYEVTFGTDGTITTLEGLNCYYSDAPSTSLGVPVASSGSTGDSATVSIGDSTGETDALIFPGAAGQSITLDFGTFGEATGLTQYSSSSSTVSVSSISQDGLGEGSYSSIGIDTDGIVSINYTNGSIRKIYQIPLATFNSPDNLQRNTGNVYTATLASGTANLHLAGTNGSGTIASGSLEDSTVDIASEFTTMIQSQQVYSANAKMVTTVNSMLNTIMQAVQ